MNEETQVQLRECFRLMAAIKAEYPEGEFDREMLHGDLDFRYLRVKELREQLQAIPLVFREFARFRNALTVPDEAIKSFFHLLLRSPECFASLVGLEFREMRKKIQTCAAELGIPASNIDRLLSRTRLTGILDSGYRLNEDYKDVISAYLAG